MNLRKLIAVLPLLAAGWFVFFLFLTDKYPDSLFSLNALSVFLPLAVIFVFWLELRGRLSLASFSLPTLGLVLSIISVFIFIDQPLVRQFFIWAAGLLVYLDFYYLYLFMSGSPTYQRGLLEKINLNFIFLTIFFSASSFFAWSVFIANTFWPLVIVFFLVIVLLAGEILYEYLRAVEKIVRPDWQLAALVIGVLATQFFWVLNLWPVGFFVKGLILSLVIYFLIYLSRHFLSGTFNGRAALKVFGLCLTLAVAILFLAKWV